MKKIIKGILIALPALFVLYLIGFTVIDAHIIIEPSRKMCF